MTYKDKLKENKEDKKMFEELEDIMFKACHLTGQHYQDEFWESIVKASVLDLKLYIDKKLKEVIPMVEKECADDYYKAIEMNEKTKKALNKILK